MTVIYTHCFYANRPIALGFIHCLLVHRGPWRHVGRNVCKTAKSSIS